MRHNDFFFPGVVFATASWLQLHDPPQGQCPRRGGYQPQRPARPRWAYWAAGVHHPTTQPTRSKRLNTPQACTPRRDSHNSDFPRLQATALPQACTPRLRTVFLPSCMSRRGPVHPPRQLPATAAKVKKEGSGHPTSRPARAVRRRANTQPSISQQRARNGCSSYAISSQRAANAQNQVAPRAGGRAALQPPPTCAGHQPVRSQRPRHPRSLCTPLDCSTAGLGEGLFRNGFNARAVLPPSLHWRQGGDPGQCVDRARDIPAVSALLDGQARGRAAPQRPQRPRHPPPARQGGDR